MDTGVCTPRTDDTKYVTDMTQTTVHRDPDTGELDTTPLRRSADAGTSEQPTATLAVSPHADDPRVDEGDERDARPRIEISFTQLFAGALAAMTAAVIGGTLGVAGTVIGAAVGSLVAGVAGSLYTVSLNRGRKGLQTLARVPAAPLTRTWATAVGRGGDRSRDGRADAAAPAVGTPGGTAPTERRAAPPSSPRKRWPMVLGASVAVFAATTVGLTAVEMVTGRSVSGDGTTTISEIGRGDDPAPQPVDEPVQDAPSPTEEAPAEETPTESPTDEVPTDEGQTPTPEPTEEPTEDPSVEPTPTPTPEPTEEPTEDPSTPEPDPTAPANP